MHARALDQSRAPFIIHGVSFDAGESVAEVTAVVTPQYGAYVRIRILPDVLTTDEHHVGGANRITLTISVIVINAVV
jgi:hypothetical protein